MAAVNARKMKYASLMGPFEDAGINEFLRALSVGRGSTAPLKNAKLPKIVDVEGWDGKDGEVSPYQESQCNRNGIKISKNFMDSTLMIKGRMKLTKTLMKL